MRRRLTKHIAAIIASLSLGACSGGPLRRVTVEMMWRQGHLGKGTELPCTSRKVRPTDHSTSTPIRH